MAQISESSNPFAGISVPGTPCVIVRKTAESVDPCVQRPEVRSGPRPPPRALKPWHGEQLARNREEPSLIAAAVALAESFDLGFSAAAARVERTRRPARAVAMSSAAMLEVRPGAFCRKILLWSRFPLRLRMRLRSLHRSCLAHGAGYSFRFDLPCQTSRMVRQPEVNGDVGSQAEAGPADAQLPRMRLLDRNLQVCPPTVQQCL